MAEKQNTNGDTSELDTEYKQLQNEKLKAEIAGLQRDATTSTRRAFFAWLAGIGPGLTVIAAFGAYFLDRAKAQELRLHDRKVAVAEEVDKLCIDTTALLWSRDSESFLLPDVAGRIKDDSNKLEELLRRFQDKMNTVHAVNKPPSKGVTVTPPPSKEIEDETGYLLTQVHGLSESGRLLKFEVGLSIAESKSEKISSPDTASILCQWIVKTHRPCPDFEAVFGDDPQFAKLKSKWHEVVLAVYPAFQALASGSWDTESIETFVARIREFRNLLASSIYGGKAIEGDKADAAFDAKIKELQDSVMGGSK